MKRSILKTTLIQAIFLFGLSVHPLFAAVYTSAQSGDFSLGSTWVGGAAPAPYDDIIIASGHTVTLDVAPIVYNITIQNGATLDNATYPLTIGNSSVGNPIYNNNGIHNGTGHLIAFDFFKTELRGNGITNCTIIIRSYGLLLLNDCQLTINGNIQHASPGNNGMNGKILIETQLGASLTINGDIITNPVYGGVGIENGANIIVNGNVSLPGSSSAGSGGIITNFAGGTFNISGNLSLGPFSSCCQNYGNMVIGGNLTGGNDTYFFQEVNAVVKFGGSVFPDGDGFLFAVNSPVMGSSEPNTIEYNGTSAQIIKLPADMAYSNLVINNSSNEGVSIDADITVNGDLSLINGLLTIADKNLNLSDTTIILGIPSSVSMIIATGTGEVRKTFTTTGSFVYPVGDNYGTVEYTPVTVNFTSGTFTAGYVGVNLVNEPYPGAIGSYLNRYWNINSSGITDFACDTQFDYVSADVTGIENNLYCYRVSPTSNQYNQTNSSTHQLSASNISSFGTYTGKQSDNSSWPLGYTVTGSGAYCEGEEGVEVGLSGSEASVVYTLFKDGVAQSPTIAGTGQAISFGNQLFGTYTVDGTNNNGTTQMSGNAVIIENVYVTPSVTIFTESGEVCEGTEVIYIAAANYGGDDPVYQWFVNGVESEENNITLTYIPANNDLISLLLTSGESCTTQNPVESNTITAIVNPVPDVIWPAFEPDTLCINWEPVLLTGGLPEGGFYSGPCVTDNYFNPFEAGIGTFWLIYTFIDSNGCLSNDSLNVFVDVCTASNIQKSSEIQVYPMPADDYINIILKNEKFIQKCELINAAGRVIGLGSIDYNHAGRATIQLNNILPGYYILKVYTNESCFYVKIVKQ
ncbi:MAG: ig family [Bacteroidetes bacterium]|nr:MAG: ig family [Bacteroidota bacterium]